MCPIYRTEKKLLHPFHNKCSCIIAILSVLIADNQTRILNDHVIKVKKSNSPSDFGIIWSMTNITVSHNALYTYF